MTGKTIVALVILAWVPLSFLFTSARTLAANQAGNADFIVSVKSGPWSDAGTWKGGKVPGPASRVRVAEGHTVTYDVDSDQVIRMVHVAGVLTFARNRHTRLDVGLILVQAGHEASESGFDCEAHVAAPDATKPRSALEVGTSEQPIPAGITARIRLVYIAGMDKQSCPAIVCCGGRMDFHGAPMNRTWLDLGKDAAKGDTSIVLSEPVTGWRVGDQVLVTGSVHKRSQDTYRGNPDRLSSETRRIVKIDGTIVTLNRALDFVHFGTGDYRSEAANLSRNVIVESADLKMRGHTMYHRHSAGSISYAEFRHLGKEGVLGRYPIHYHLAGDTMRGSYVQGASIWDSHNRFLTIHGTNFLVVRDCVGYQSVGHGFFLEDGTEVYNTIDRNLGVQAYRGKPLPNQVLTFDPNDGAAFWWSNGRNTLTRNTACENDEYGFRFDSQKTSKFNSELRVLMADGVRKSVDIRALPFYRFEDNEAHTEGLYGMVFAGPGLIAPDTRHPHILKNLKIWNTHYALRPQIPKMWVESVKISGATYGVYRAEVDHHVYRNMYLTKIFSRVIGFAGRADGHGRGGIQQGSFSYDGLALENLSTHSQLICMNQTSPHPGIAGHFRNLSLKNVKSQNNVVDITVGLDAARLDHGVAYYFHLPLPAKTAKVVSDQFPQLMKGSKFGQMEGFTGKNVKIAAVDGIEFPKLLDPVDDLPPATVITSPAPAAAVKLENGVLIVRGTTTDNTQTKRVVVNGIEARSLDHNFHAWEARLTNQRPGPITLTAFAEDEAGNVEKMAHQVMVIAR